MLKDHLVLASPDSSTVRSLVLGLSWVGQTPRGTRTRTRERDTTRNIPTTIGHEKKSVKEEEAEVEE